MRALLLILCLAGCVEQPKNLPVQAVDRDLTLSVDGKEIPLLRHPLEECWTTEDGRWVLVNGRITCGEKTWTGNGVTGTFRGSGLPGEVRVW